jgi:hypothetical protein
VSDVAALCRRFETLKTLRVVEVETVWRDCFDFTYPLRGSGIQGTVLTANSGQDRQARLLDSTAADSCNTLASNIMSGLTPSSALWFALDVGNESDEERRWLDESATLLWENIHMANFDAEAFEACLDICCAGMFALFIDEDTERGGFTFHQWPLAEVYCASTRADGRVDIVHRPYKLTAEQAAREFGIDNVPESIRRALEKQPDVLFDFLHVIQPRANAQPGGKFAKKLPIESCHIALAEKMEVRESGYHEMPIVVPRWLRVPRSIYAIGPMYAALPDVRNLNQMKFFGLAAADIAVSGMWLAVDDGILNPRTVKIGARKVIVAADKDSFTPLSSGGDFNLSEALIAKLQGAIRKTLMADQLVPQDGPQMTAEEVRVRVDMVRKLLGPIYGRLQAEYLKPLIERCFGLASRAQIFTPAPESLRTRNYSVRYVSPMARAQKLDEVQAIEAVFTSAGQFAAFDPTIIDQLDPREAIKRMIEGRGAPDAILRTPEAIQQITDQRAEAQRQSQAEAGQQQAQQVGAETAAKQAAVAA